MAMNTQDNTFNTLLDNIATPDKPESPVISGTGSLEDDFTISEAGDNPVLPENDEASAENPLLFNDPDADFKEIDAAKLRSRINLNALDLLFDWDFDSISPTIIYHDKTLTSSIVSLLVLLIVSSIPTTILILILNDMLSSLNSSFAPVFFIFYAPLIIPVIIDLVILYGIILSLITIFHTKINYTLKIIIHNNEIILEEISKTASQIYAFPRNSKDLQIEVTPFKFKNIELSNVSIRSQGSHFSPNRAFDSKDASELITLIKQICNDQPLTSTSSPSAPNHLDSSAQLIDSSAQLIDSSAQLTNNDSDEDYFL